VKTALLGSLLVMTVAAASAGVARAEIPVGLEVHLGGGSVIAWDGADETGNAFGGLVLLGLGNFDVGLGGAAALPDSRLQGEFGAFWVEGRWSYLGREDLFSPYVVTGLGFATGDGFEPSGTGFLPARWSSETGFLGMFGTGLRFSEPTGMSLSADVRSWNVSHLGIQLLVGYRFF
jgi:hypothetical protein